MRVSIQTEEPLVGLAEDLVGNVYQVRDGLFELYACVEDGVFGPLENKQKGVAGDTEEITLKPAENSQKQVAGRAEGNHPLAATRLDHV